MGALHGKRALGSDDAVEEEAMSFEVRCTNPACRKLLRVREELAGKKARCSGCGMVIQIPALEEPIVAEEAEPEQVRSQRSGRQAPTTMADMGEEDFEEDAPRRLARKARRIEEPEDDDYEDDEEHEERPRPKKKRPGR